MVRGTSHLDAGAWRSVYVLNLTHRCGTGRMGTKTVGHRGPSCSLRIQSLPHCIPVGYCNAAIKVPVVYYGTKAQCNWARIYLSLICALLCSRPLIFQFIMHGTLGEGTLGPSVTAGSFLDDL